MYNFLKVPVVKNFYNVFALLLILLWAIAVFLLNIKGLIHLFLVIALIMILISIIRSEI